MNISEEESFQELPPTEHPSQEDETDEIINPYAQMMIDGKEERVFNRLTHRLVERYRIAPDVDPYVIGYQVRVADSIWRNMQQYTKNPDPERVLQYLKKIVPPSKWTKRWWQTSNGSLVASEIVASLMSC